MDTINWITWVYTACCVLIGMGIKSIVDDVRYPKPKHRWKCPHCPLKIGASDKEFLRIEAEKHHDRVHPFEADL